MFGKLKERLTGGAQRLNGKTDLLEGICAACVLTGSADGDFSDDEAMTALDRLQNHDTISAAFSPTQIEQAFDKQAKRAKSGMSGKLGLRREIEEVRAKATEEDCEMLLVIALDVALAAGDISAAERNALDKVAQAVGLSVDRYLS